MRTISTYLGIGLMTLGMVLAAQSTAEAQYPYTITPMQTVVTPVQTYAPAVVGYAAERRGLFGRRIVYRPLVAPALGTPVVVAAPLAMVTQTTAMIPSPVVAARPVIQAPTVWQSHISVAPVVVSRPVVVARPTIAVPTQVVVARPMLTAPVLAPPIVVTQPQVINRYYPPIYPAPFAPVAGY